MALYIADNGEYAKMKEPAQTLARPENKGVIDHTSGSVKPWELDAELMQLKMAEMMVSRLGTPSVINKKFIVRYGIFTALNHTPTNPTGLDCSLRIKVYEKVAAQSINEDGKYFERYWAYMMKPKYIINAGAPMQGQPQEEKQSIAGRIWGFMTGRKKNEQQVQQ